MCKSQAIKALVVTLVLVLTTARAVAQSTGPQQPSDWDLYMMKLVNAARTDPAAENQLRGTNYSNPPVAPLAYDSLVGQAAANHNQWMLTNIGSPLIIDATNTGFSPDSFTHSETYNALSSGIPATATPGYTGVSAGNRLTYTGFQYSAWGENIYWSSFAVAISAPRIEGNHLGWWKSDGHRNNLMRATYSVMGHDAVIGEDHFASQVFARPGGSVRTHLLGVLYNDRNLSGAWEPHDVGDPNREGLGGVPYLVYDAATNQQVGDESFTNANGSFTFRVGSGTYDLQFLLGGSSQWVRDVTLDGVNIDLGDIQATPLSPAGDYNGDGIVDLSDFTQWRDQLNANSTLPGDSTPGEVAVDDYVIWRTNYASSGANLTTAEVPEPASLFGLLLGCVAMRVVRTHKLG